MRACFAVSLGCLLLPLAPARGAVETLVIKPARTIDFSTSEGTWMSVDVSPDGATLLVDLLGDLYTLPSTGGELRPLTTGMAWDFQARYSPDGKRIAFISDRNGSDNIWIMNADGSEPRELTKEKKFMFGSPVWSPQPNTSSRCPTLTGLEKQARRGISLVLGGYATLPPLGTFQNGRSPLRRNFVGEGSTRQTNLAHAICIVARARILPRRSHGPARIRRAGSTHRKCIPALTESTRRRLGRTPGYLEAGRGLERVKPLPTLALRNKGLSLSDLAGELHCVRSACSRASRRTSRNTAYRTEWMDCRKRSRCPSATRSATFLRCSSAATAAMGLRCYLF